MEKPKILLIDDSEDIHIVLKKTIGPMANVTSVYNFTDAKIAFGKDEFAIVIIDLNLADKNGMDLLKEFKNHPNKSRFFIMTGKDSISDELMGHKYGVDEYIKKPVNRDILKAIVEKNIKIIHNDAADEILIGQLHILTSEFRVFVKSENGNEEILNLTVKEFKILVKLASHPEKAFSREDLFNQIWEGGSESTFRTIDKTIHHVGYKFSL
jgi:two-component system, OmpR family, response regulator